MVLEAREGVMLPDSINVNVNIMSKTPNVRERVESSTPSQRGNVVDLRPIVGESNICLEPEVDSEKCKVGSAPENNLGVGG